MNTLGDVIKIETGEQLNKSDMLPDAEHPVVNGGIDFSGYTDKYNSEANTITISQGGASAGYVNWLDQKFWAGAHCYVVTPLPNNDVRFLYHFIKSREYNFIKNQQGAGIPSLNRSEVYKTAFPDLDYNKQKEIAVILDSFTSMITNLETELVSRQKQYEYYRNKLLTFDENDESAEWKTLGEIGHSFNGLTGKSKKDFENGNSVFVTYSNVFNNPELNMDISERVMISEGEKQNIIHEGDILFTGSSETPDEAGMSSVVLKKTNCNMYLNSFCFGLRLDNFNLVQPSYVKYVLRSQRIRNNISKTAFGVTRFNINKEKFFKVVIPIPSLQRQQEIVSTLDTFESLITNLKQEIAARKKQYEYYREQLLTF